MLAAGGLEGDPIEQANADAEDKLQVRLHESDAHLVRAIEEALARIRRGTFGMCEVCQQPITKARLAAVPWTRHCRNPSTTRTETWPPVVAAGEPHRC